MLGAPIKLDEFLVTSYVQVQKRSNGQRTGRKPGTARR